MKNRLFVHGVAESVTIAKSKIQGPPRRSSELGKISTCWLGWMVSAVVTSPPWAWQRSSTNELARPQ